MLTEPFSETRPDNPFTFKSASLFLTVRELPIEARLDSASTLVSLRLPQIVRYDPIEVRLETPSITCKRLLFLSRKY